VQSHLVKEQAEADAAVVRKRIIQARLDQEEKLAEERARRDTQVSLSRLVHIVCLVLLSTH
jgi:hypothetical protein